MIKSKTTIGIGISSFFSYHRIIITDTNRYYCLFHTHSFDWSVDRLVVVVVVVVVHIWGICEKKSQTEIESELNWIAENGKEKTS